MEQVIARIVEDHSNSGERNARGAELERHLDQWAVLIKVFEWIKSHIFVFFRLVCVFFVLSIFV